MEFSREEIRAIITLGLVTGFIVSFSELFLLQQGHLLVTTQGIIVFLLACFGMVVSVWIHELGHKFFANAIGYKTNTESYYPGQVIGIALSIVSFGHIIFFTPNTSDLEADPQARINKHRKYENFRQQAFIAASGLFITGFLAVLLHGAYIFTNAALMRDLMLGNVCLLVYSLVPFELASVLLLRIQQKIEQLPQSDGLYIFHYSFPAYVFAAASAAALALILLFSASTPVWVALFVGFVAATFVWFKFFIEGN